MDNDVTSKITISTHNVNGFKRSKDFLFSQCHDNPDSIRAIQEHWLRPPYKKQAGVNQLRCVHPLFDGFGASAMSKVSENKLLSGRPFGGTGFLYNKKFAKCLKPLLNFSHDRVTVMELNTHNGKIILINAYMPYYNSRDLENYTALYRDTAGFIDNVMHTHRDCKFIVLADFNCDLTDDSHRFTEIIRQLMVKYNLISAFELDPTFDYTASYTRSDTKTNSFTLIDGILISKGLKSIASNIRISQCGDNVSDHSPVEIDLNVVIEESNQVKARLPQYVSWNKLTRDDKLRFRDKMTESLSAIDLPAHELLHGDMCCQDESHIHHIEKYYNDIVIAVSQAESVLPKTDPNKQRSFWNPELVDLKQRSIDCNNHWKNNGSPRSGPIFKCRKRCHYTYKAAIRRAKVDCEKQCTTDLHNDLLEKNGISFWNSWNAINKVGNQLSSRINGHTDEKSIANEFAGFFESIYSDHDTPEHTALKNEFNQSFARYYTDHRNDSINPYLVTWSEMIDVAANIKAGKSTAGSLRPEHFLLGSGELLRHLQTLFNAMLQHSYVPTDFLRGTISPIVKDSQGDMSDTSNYRGITLSCLPAKLFEYIVQAKVSRLLGTDDLQFGFKSKTSTSHAIFTLKATIDHFNKKGSNVFVAFLDCTKAFDRISHYGLFTKLIQRNVPLCILLCLIYWYANMSCLVKWGNESSRVFDVPLGIKQGGINSPDFFAIYFDELTKILRKKGIGCQMYKLYLAIIMFADDICLLAPTRSTLQKLVDICSSYCSKYGLAFNPKKSKILVFSKSKMDLSQLQAVILNNKKIEYVTSIVYLGTTIKSDNGFKFSVTNDLRKFYRASNSILSVLNKPSEEVSMQLLYTNCVVILSYACEVKSFSAKETRDCNTAMNDAIRKIFSFNRWESVRHLRESLGYKSIYEIFAEAKKRFANSLIIHHNHTLRIIHTHLTDSMH